MPTSRTLTAAAIVLAVPALALGVDYDESISGDLSNDEFNPTPLGVLTEGPHTVNGSTTANPLDLDFFTFEIAAGTELDSITLTNYAGPAGGGSFIALTTGDQFTSLFDTSGYLGATLIGVSPGAQTGDDILDDLGSPIFGGTGFSGALGPGVYSIWYQETGDPTDYGFQLNVTPAPGAVALIGCAGLGAMRRRRA
ncbi:MAG: hypothetical protein Tsb0013_16770 [Phycisphaerales bacterium]